MNVIICRRVEFFKAEITIENLCRVILREIDGGGENAGEIEICIDSPDTIQQLGLDLITAALMLKQELQAKGVKFGADAF